ASTLIVGASPSQIHDRTSAVVWKEQVDQPAAAEVGPAVAAVVEQAVVGAAGVLQGVAQDGHLVEAALVAQGAGQADDGAVVDGQPLGGQVDGLERVAQQLAHQGGLGDAGVGP